MRAGTATGRDARRIDDAVTAEAGNMMPPYTPSAALCNDQVTAARAHARHADAAVRGHATSRRTILRIKGVACSNRYLYHKCCPGFADLPESSECAGSTHWRDVARCHGGSERAQTPWRAFSAPNAAVYHTDYGAAAQSDSSTFTPTRARACLSRPLAE